MVAQCSVALLGQVVCHFLDKLEASIHALGFAKTVDLVFFPKSDHESAGSLSDNDATAATGKLSNSSLGLFVSEHHLGASDTDTSLGGSLVSITSGKGASDFVDLNVRHGSIESLHRVLVSGEVAALRSSGGPKSAIVAVDSGATVDSGDRPIVGVVVESVEHLVGVLLPRVFSHLSILIV